MQPRKGVILALSSGGVRGFAHIGVLKVLDRYRVPIVGIAGSSMGGLIGGLYCAGYTGSMIQEVALNVRRSDWIDFSLSKMGLLAGKKLEALLTQWTHGCQFEECSPPLKVVAVDIETGSPVLIESGPLAAGIRATVSIPGIFSPVVRNQKILVDGGVLNRVPVDVARLFGDCPVVAVDVGVELAPTVGSMFDVLFQTFDLMAYQLQQFRPVKADLMIEPRLQLTREAHFSKIPEVIQAGEVATEQAISKILDLIQIDGTAMKGGASH